MLVGYRSSRPNTKVVLILIQYIYMSLVLEIFIVSVILSFVLLLPSLGLSESTPSLTPLLSGIFVANIAEPFLERKNGGGDTVWNLAM